MYNHFSQEKTQSTVTNKIIRLSNVMSKGAHPVSIHPFVQYHALYSVLHQSETMNINSDLQSYTSLDYTTNITTYLERKFPLYL